MIAKRTGSLAILAALVLTTGLSSQAVAEEGKAYQIDLEQLNDSGSRGTAMLSLRDNQLTVQIESEGMVPGQPSAQHLHGSTDGHDFHCPDASDDTNGDGLLNNTEATVDYGDINISLTVTGDTGAGSGLAVDRMPVADAAGKLSYSRTITVSQDVVEHIKDLHIVQHGIDRNDNNEYDFEGAGKSELDPKLPQEATAPTNCGMVMGAAVGSIPVGGIETGGDPAPGSALPTGAIGSAALLCVVAASAAAVMRRRSAATTSAVRGTGSTGGAA
ncbi:hypothetical protein [Streptomyces sp. NPDC006879]|uniref:hypothetical protein n=1 Tax=Streptomyces sp. NPDC006879 TaxID=3364767 RepID=UPI0036805A45